MDLAAWIEATALSQALRGSGTLYLLVNAAHVLAVGLLVGAVLPLDLRILGLIGGPPLPVVGPFLARTAGVGLGLAMATGACLWSVNAVEYLGNAAFQWKLMLLAGGLANVALLHGTRWRRVIATGRADGLTRGLAAISALLWLAVLLAGRWIGFL